jgi:predicted short-subunit dehydrogenase-like oxidoreductase (DUF2520 family)
MKIGFIGAGKVGLAFGTYLFQNDFNIIGYYSRRYECSVKGAELTKSIAFKEIKELVDNSEMLFITTNDDAIINVCNSLVSNNILREGQIIVHMSGASSSKILENAKEIGCSIYSIHPLQSFADVDKAIEDLKSTVFSIEGDADKIEIIENMFNKTSNKYFKLSSEQKSLYHIAACVMSNYLVTLMEYGLSLLNEIGIDNEEGYKAFYPLIQGSIDNIYNLGTKKALTGPIARGDIDTIDQHMKALKELDHDKLEIYKILGDMTLNLAIKEKLKGRNKINEIKNKLKEV